VQKLSADVLLFNVPLALRFKSKSGTANREITVKQLAEDFSLALPEAPEIVRFNPELALLAKITFAPPTTMLYAQLADPGDMIGRLLAVEQLGEKKDTQAIPRLKETLNSDPFYGVRIAASRALRAIGTDAAFEALLASVKQSDARVRRQVVSDLTSFYREASYAAALRVLQDEKNPDIQAVALRSLGGYFKPEVRELLLKYLSSDSDRNLLADTAIETLRAQDDPSYLPPLLACLRTNEARFTSWGFGRALETLARIARNEEKKETIREFLLGYVNDLKKRVQLSAIAALGTLGDVKAAAALEKFTTGAKDSPERGAAERALAALRETRKPATEPAALRNEVSELQKQTRELRKELDELKKKLEAAPAKPGGTNTSKAKAAVKPAKR